MADELLSTVTATHPSKEGRGSSPCRNQHARWAGEELWECPKMRQDWKGWWSPGPRTWSRPKEEVYLVCYLEVLSGKVAGAPYTHTHTHTQCLSWQEEEMPCIFQPLVPRPSLNASPKNTAWKQSFANSSLLSLSPSFPHPFRFIFEWGRCVKGVTLCWRNLSPLLSCLLSFSFLEWGKEERREAWLPLVQEESKGDGAERETRSPFLNDLVTWLAVRMCQAEHHARRTMETRVKIYHFCLQGTCSLNGARTKTKKSTLPKANSKVFQPVLKCHPFELLQNLSG